MKCRGDSAHELRDSHAGISRWNNSLWVQGLTTGSKKPHPRAADACAKGLPGMSVA